MKKEAHRWAPPSTFRHIHLPMHMYTHRKSRAQLLWVSLFHGPKGLHGNYSPLLLLGERQPRVTNNRPSKLLFAKAVCLLDLFCEWTFVIRVLETFAVRNVFGYTWWEILWYGVSEKWLLALFLWFKDWVGVSMVLHMFSSCVSTTS